MKAFPATFRPDLMRLLTAQSVAEDVPLPVANPGHRPTGCRTPLHLQIVSTQPSAREVATRTRPERDAAAFVAAIVNANDRSIVVDIDCWGGRGDGSRAIALALLEHPWSVTTRILGRCASAACLIAVAGDERLIAPDATMLVHGARLVMTPEDYERFCQCSDRDAVLRKLSESDAETAAILVARSGVDLKTIRQWLRRDHELTADQAVRYGLATAITTKREN